MGKKCPKKGRKLRGKGEGRAEFGGKKRAKKERNAIGLKHSWSNAWITQSTLAWFKQSNLTGC